MKDNIPPEEKLLKLIRAHKNQYSAAADTGRQAKESHAAIHVKYSSLYRIKGSFRALDIEKLMRLVFFFSCICLAALFFYLPLRSKKVGFSGGNVLSAPGEGKGVLYKVRPYSYYLEGIKGKQIFSLRYSRETDGPLAGNDIDIIRDIKLIGIISGGTAQAIIEDKKQQKTYYLTIGQFLGEFQLEEIKAGEGKIILSRYGRRYELYL